MTRPEQSLEVQSLGTGCRTGGIAGAYRGSGWLLPAAVPILTLAGCASQGPLRPPSLQLPAQVRGLAAERVGDVVELHWTAPTRTTDGLPLSGKHFPLPLSAEICREAVAACVPLGRVAAAGTQGSFQDVLPASLLSGPPRVLRYRVRMLNGSGKGAADAVVEALAGTAPASLQKVQATPAENGVLLRWQPDVRADGERILLRVRRDAPADGEGAPMKQNQPGRAGTKVADTLLSVEERANDRAGTLDAGAKPGVAQHYSIQREQTVRIGGEDLSMRSAPVVVLVAAEAKLPPVPPPAGLEAIANTLGPLEIDLVWQPETGATGYRVFRAEGAGTPVLLTKEPVGSLTYSDTSVRQGTRYRYSIASVGRDGIAGPAGKEVDVEVPGR